MHSIELFPPCFMNAVDIRDFPSPKIACQLGWYYVVSEEATRVSVFRKHEHPLSAWHDMHNNNNIIIKHFPWPPP